VQNALGATRHAVGAGHLTPWAAAEQLLDAGAAG